MDTTGGDFAMRDELDIKGVSQSKLSEILTDLSQKGYLGVDDEYGQVYPDNDFHFSDWSDWTEDNSLNEYDEAVLDAKWYPSCTCDSITNIDNC